MILKRDNLKRNNDILIFSLIVLIVLIYSATVQLYKIQLGKDIDTFRLILLYISNALFVIQLYVHFYSFVNQHIFARNVAKFKTVHITHSYKGYKFLYHIFVCIMALYYFNLMSSNESLDELRSILLIANFIMYQHYVISISAKNTRNLKGEFRVGLFELSNIVLLEFDRKIYYVSSEINTESFVVYKYKISENGMNIYLYNEKQLSPYITLIFKMKTKKYNDIIMFLKENCEINNDKSGGQ